MEQFKKKNTKEFEEKSGSGVPNVDTNLCNVLVWSALRIRVHKPYVQDDYTEIETDIQTEDGDLDKVKS